MQAVGGSVLTRGGRVVVATAGLMVLLALQPESVRLVEPAAAGLAPSATAVRTLIISEQARRYLALQRSEEHTSELQSLAYLVCRLLLEKKKTKKIYNTYSR